MQIGSNWEFEMHLHVADIAVPRPTPVASCVYLLLYARLYTVYLAAPIPYGFTTLIELTRCLHAPVPFHPSF